MSHYRLIEQREIVPPPSAAALDTAVETALDAALGGGYRLPSFARSYTFHHGEPRLARALRPLQGKFSIVNPALVVPLPPPAREQLRALAGRAATSAIAPRARAPLAVALHEPVRAEVRHESRVPASTMPGRDIFFWAELRYRALLGRGAPLTGDPERAAAAHVEAPPVQWFHLALLVPDDDALRQMTPATAHFYRHVTGRLGGGSRDRYWYLDAWERFHEEGQVIGCVSPSLVEHGHVGGAVRDAASRPTPQSPPTDEELLFGSGGSYAPSRFDPYTPAFDRRGFVPPGYCLIHYFATVEVAVVNGASRGIAA
ncbi:MAG TPA: hypothetical protein VFS08_01820 [Gemmatimonadaceae bacterium]|nr:hypothetical protein [Gemmatimonadaceae bacterium]